MRVEDLINHIDKLAIAPNGQLVTISDVDIIAIGHVLQIKVKYMIPWWRSKTLFFRPRYFYDGDYKKFKLLN